MASLPSNLILETVRTDTGAHNGTTYAVDSSVFSTGVPDWTIWVEVTALSPGATARVSLQDSVDNFVTPIAGPTFEIGPGLAGSGAQISKTYPVRRTWKRADSPGLRFAAASGVMRIALTLVQGILPSVSWWAGYQGPLSN
jgi:hypothetical protein